MKRTSFPEEHATTDAILRPPDHMSRSTIGLSPKLTAD
jgi:hypothetical protein